MSRKKGVATSSSVLSSFMPVVPLGASVMELGPELQLSTVAFQSAENGSLPAPLVMRPAGSPQFQDLPTMPTQFLPPPAGLNSHVYSAAIAAANTGLLTIHGFGSNRRRPPVSQSFLRSFPLSFKKYKDCLFTRPHHRHESNTLAGCENY